MKSIAIILLIAAIQFPALVFASGEKPRSVVFRVYHDDFKYIPKQKQIPGKKQRIIGISLTAVGVGLMGTGVALMATTKWIKTQTPTGVSYNTNDPKAAVGMIMALPGFGLTVPGAILWGIGDRNIRRYKKNELKKQERAAKKLSTPDDIPKQQKF